MFFLKMVANYGQRRLLQAKEANVFKDTMVDEESMFLVSEQTKFLYIQKQMCKGVPCNHVSLQILWWTRKTCLSKDANTSKTNQWKGL